MNRDADCKRARGARRWISIVAAVASAIVFPTASAEAVNRGAAPDAPVPHASVPCSDQNGVGLLVAQPPHWICFGGSSGFNHFATVPVASQLHSVNWSGYVTNADNRFSIVVFCNGSVLPGNLLPHNITSVYLSPTLAPWCGG
jgi:hypothetical protein